MIIVLDQFQKKFFKNTKKELAKKHFQYTNSKNFKILRMYSVYVLHNFSFAMPIHSKRTKLIYKNSAIFRFYFFILR